LAEGTSEKHAISRQPVSFQLFVLADRLEC
jgi:hypothetical protein